MLMEKKQLIIEASYLEFIELLSLSKNFIFQPITPEIAYQSVTGNLGKISDPADRLISATSLISGFPLVTGDKNILGSPAVQTIW